MTVAGLAELWLEATAGIFVNDFTPPELFSHRESIMMKPDAIAVRIKCLRSGHDGSGLNHRMKDSHTKPMSSASLDLTSSGRIFIGTAACSNNNQLYIIKTTQSLQYVRYSWLTLRGCNSQSMHLLWPRSNVYHLSPAACNIAVLETATLESKQQHIYDNESCG